MNQNVVFISGASSGLGLSLSQKFIEERWLVVGISLSRKHWKKALTTISSPDFKLFQLDVTKELKVRKFISFVWKKFKRIDLIINNAGYGGQLSQVEKISRPEMQKHIEFNLYSAFYVCKYAIPIFKKQKRGFIINISSMAGKRAVPKLAAYSMSKFGVVALSQCIAKENKEDHIKCITICPGGMNTEMRSSLFGRENAQRQQSTDFVTDVIDQIVRGELKVDSGADVVIRHSQVTVNPVPSA